MDIRLKGIPETLLIPLWARATETHHSEPIVRDPLAVEMLAKIDYDFSKFRKARMSQLGVSIRTMLLDRAAQTLLDASPRVCVVNLGSGLDTRYSRLRHRDTLWYELDLPEVIELRRRFFEENETYRFLSNSVFDVSWMDEVRCDDRTVLFIAEGLFMYFEQRELRTLVSRLAQRFAGAHMLIEVQGPGLVGKATKHDALSQMDKIPEFKWGTSNSRDMTAWYPGIELVEEWSFFAQHADRAGWMGWLMRIPPLRRKYEPRIVHLRLPGGVSE